MGNIQYTLTISRTGLKPLRQALIHTVKRYFFNQQHQIVKRRGNRRYYQRADVITIRQIRSLLYDQGYTIGGAKQKLSSSEVKDDTSQYKQLIRQMITELEEVLDVLNTPVR